MHPYFDNHPTLRLITRSLLITFSAFLFSLNLKTFVYSAGLLPGGFTGVVLLIQEIFIKYFRIKIPFSLILYIMNSVPAVICFRIVGKKFTLYSIAMIVLSGLFTDLVPGLKITADTLLCLVFGGIINGFAINLCLYADATSGGTDFISIIVSEKTGNSAWNYIFAGNCIVLIVAGLLFSWDRALYSIIFQFTTTQVLNTLYKRYRKTTLFIISDHVEEIIAVIRRVTNHDATLFKGIGCYKGVERKMIYTVISSEQSNILLKEIKKVDHSSFINVFDSKEVLGRFFVKNND